MEINKFVWYDIEKDGLVDINPYKPLLIAYIRPEFPNNAVYGYGHYGNNSFYIQNVNIPVKVIGYAEIPEFSGERQLVKDTNWIVNKHKSSAILAFRKVLGKIKLTKKQQEHCSEEDFVKEFLKNEA